MGEETATIEKIEDKIDKGEALTPEEQKLIDNAPSTKEEEASADETIDPEKIKVEKTKDSKTADTPAEKDAEAAKAKEQEAADTATQEAERKKLIEAEAEKPLDEAEIADYSPTERALFFELRKERRKRQDSQRETDTLRFNKQREEYRKQIEAEKAAEEEKKKAAEETDPFEGMEDDDLLTAGQIKKILSGRKESPKKEATAPTQEILRAQKLQEENWVLKAQAKLPDVNLQEITNLADEILMVNGKRDTEASFEIDEVVAKGGNPIIALYNFFKANPKYSSILEERLKATGVKSEDEKKKAEEARTNKERAERIEANKKKPVTTGSGGGAAASGEYTIQEVLDMSEEEFAKLPKSQRDKILQEL